MYNEYEIRPMPLSVPHCRQQVEHFLEANNLRLEEVEYYACVFKYGEEENILAGGGLYHDIIKCIAVSNQLRDEGFSSRLVSHLISEAHAHGHHSVKVFTKPENLSIFENLGFLLIAQATHAILLENGEGLSEYCQYLSEKAHEATKTDSSLPFGVIVMNANPFTHGHRYLIERAAEQVGRLFVIVVKEDKSLFPYSERYEMVRKGTADIPNVQVCEGSSYSISAATFPSYFMKELSQVTDTQICLDLDLFVHHLAPALNASIRFIGSEPIDPLTARYNQLIKEILSQHGLQVRETERKKFKAQGGEGAEQVISASLLRQRLKEGSFLYASRLAFPTSIPYLIAHAVSSALQQELETTPKPGLVDLHDNGAHQDMDLKMMRKSIGVLHPFFAKMAEIPMSQDLNQTVSGIRESVPSLMKVGKLAEEAMFEETHGTNTHKGALFSLGITAYAAACLICQGETCTTEMMQRFIKATAAQFPYSENTHGATVKNKYNIKGALDNAREGYPQLFEDWLPYYRSLPVENKHRRHKTLLRIMSSLDDSNVYFRGDASIAQEVKDWAQKTLSDHNMENAYLFEKELQKANTLFIKKNISPGGSADMLSLTILMDILTK